MLLSFCVVVTDVVVVMVVIVIFFAVVVAIILKTLRCWNGAGSAVDGGTNPG